MEVTQTSLGEQIKHGLDEILILITGVEILIGFQYSAVFNSGFDKLNITIQYSQLVGLGLLLLTLLLVISPVAYHRIADQGRDTQHFCRYIRRIILSALLPFALGLGLDVYIIVQKIAGSAAGILIGAGVGLAALIFWYIIEFLRRQRDGRAHMKQTQPLTTAPSPEPTKLSDKVDHVLTEARVVLPGAQALLGFQFISVLAEGFDKLSHASQLLHLISLLLIAFSTILLMTPAAYHRIVEQGEDTEHFCRLAGRFVLAAMAALALGITLNYYVVADKITGSPSFALTTTVLMLIVFYGFWFGYTAYRRQHKSSITE